MKKLTVLYFAALVVLASCSYNSKEIALRNAQILDSLQRDLTVRDSITLDSIKRETYNHDKRGGKIDYDPQNKLHNYAINTY